MALFNIGKQSIPTPEDEFNKLLGIEDIPEKKNEIIDVKVELLDEIRDQPFKFRREKAEQIAESAKQVGILEPIIVRAKKNGRYDIIAGRHRAAGAKIAEIDTVPCIVKDVTKDIAKFILLSTNTDRNNEYSYSELAFAYKQQADLLKKLGNNVPSTSKIAEDNNTNKKKIQRYIRLTLLISPLLRLVDNGEISFIGAVELSHLEEDNQKELLKFLLKNNVKVTVEQAKQIKKHAADNQLTSDYLNAIFYPQTENTFVKSSDEYQSSSFVPPLEGQIEITEYTEAAKGQNKATEVVENIPTETETTDVPQTEFSPTEVQTEIKENSISPNTESRENNEPKAEKKTDNLITKENNGYVPSNVVKEVIKQHYNKKQIYLFYTFCVPTPSRAIKEMLKPKYGYEGETVLFTHNRNGFVNLTSQYVDIVYYNGRGRVSYSDIDKYIRELINDGKLLASNEIIEVISDKCKELKK